MEPCKQAPAAQLTIEAFLEEGPPVFTGTLEDLPVRIALQSSAIMALTDRFDRRDVAGALQHGRPLVSSAAQRLYESGFYREAEGSIEIMITALDL
jgi:hypothetical protein